MKIGIDIRTAGGEKAGKGWFTFNIVRSLLKIDAENEYYLYADGGIAGFEEFKNVKLVINSNKGLSWHILTANDIKKRGIDIFYAPSSFIIPALLPKRIKTIITIHDLVAFFFPNTHNKKAVFIEKVFLKKAIKKAVKITTVSENTRTDVIERFKVPEEKIEVINCAAAEEFAPISDTAILDDFRTKTNLPKKFFLAVGTIEPRKNYETLIQAFSMMHESHPNYHLVIVGGKGWGDSEIDKLIRGNYLQKYVHFLGYITPKSHQKLYNLATALVFPSYYEGFGIPPLEAMQSGCPVISTHTSSLPEVIGQAGIFCDPSQPAEFAKEMENIAGNESLRQDLINKGRIQSKKFSYKDSAQKLLKLIKSL